MNRKSARISLLFFAFLFPVLLSINLTNVAEACPLFVQEDATFLTSMEITPLDVPFELTYDEYHQGMPYFSVNANETYEIEIKFYLNDTAAVFIKVLQYNADSVGELCRISVPSSRVSVGWNTFNATLSASDAGHFCMSVVAVAGHRDDDGSSPWNAVMDENFGTVVSDWNFPLGDGYFAGRAAEELSWDGYEAAYRFHMKVVGPAYTNPFVYHFSATPDKTTLTPGEVYSVTIKYYRTYYCPSDYIKIFYRNEATGVITEVDRWAKPYWEIVSSGWGPMRSPYYGAPLIRTLTAPMEPGTYTVKAVICSGHGTYNYYGVDWNDRRSDGGFAPNHKPEELSWTFYEQVAEFTISVSGEDTYPPITKKTLTGILGSCGWYVSDVTVTLTATDAWSGVNKTEYSFDNVTWIEYTGPFMITSEGITTIFYRSIDNAGNVEEVKSQVIKIDKTCPTITVASPEPRNYTQDETLTISFDATDMVSGVASITGLLCQDPAVIYLDPQVSTAAVGETFSIDVCIADAVGVVGWQVKVNYDPAVLRGVSFTEGGFLSSVGPISYVPPSINQEEGYIMFTCCLIGAWPPVSGSGTLATVTFQCIGLGETVLDMIDENTIIFNENLEDLPREVVNGYFTSIMGPEEHDIAVTNVAVSTTKVTSGEPVTITVVVKNQGTRSETFDVTVFYDSNIIAMQSQVSLWAGASKTLTFTWNTAGVGLGSYQIKAEATVVPGEIETIDNTFVNDIVMVRIPVYSGQTLDLSTFELGTYTLTVIAIDNACNEAIESVTFTVATTISGTVIDEYTKEPISGVTISILETNETVVTDECGRYRFIIHNTGIYTVEMTVPYGYLTHDDVTKFVEVMKTTEVNFTLYKASWSGAKVPRTIGYWKNWDSHYTAEMMETFIAHVKSASGLFSDLTVDNLKSYLTMGRTSMEQKVQAQLLASWLNVVSAQLGVDVKVDLSSIEGWEQVITIPEGSVLTVGELLKQIDNLYVTDVELTKEQWEIVKNILDALNNRQLFFE